MSVPLRTVSLCSEGWRLYDVYQIASETGTPPEMRIAWHEYQQHLLSCRVCTVKVKKDNDDSVISRSYDEKSIALKNSDTR